MKKLSFILIASNMLLSACTKDITGLNVNTKAASNVPSSTLFTMGEKALVDNFTTTSVATAPFRVISQEWTENSYVYEAQYNFAAYQANAGWWNSLYEGALANLQAAKSHFASDVLDPAIAINDMRIADILEVYTYDLLLNTYGDIPYTEALNNSIPFPKYDDAKTIYSDLLTRLDTCIAGLNTNAASFGAADLIYGGNVAAWKKFAATLELKMAIRLADVDATTASSAVLKAVAAGVFSSNDDNALLAYDPSSPNNSNPIWQALVYSGRHDFVPASLLVSTMVSWNDPRLPLYFTKYNGSYSGGIPGNGNGYGAFSDFSAQLQVAGYPGVLLNYSQAEFLLAEAVERGIAVGGTAQSHYNNAVTASIEFWGGAASDAIAYLAQPSVNYATATGTWQQKLGYQEWIANYNMNWDSWTDIRRLGYPDIDVVSPPVGAHGNLPLRLTYPSNESASNSTNWKTGVAALPGGQDLVSAKLFWMP
ncbi:MAG: SusD/RagB family nutrient-binding outer membrane lipoprotein [Bacteroidetes bacterium]|nr:SusD/RagB family nutrient-binding outer membrane lipoprotein [Bacteroidota bacterium]